VPFDPLAFRGEIAGKSTTELQDDFRSNMATADNGMWTAAVRDEARARADGIRAELNDRGIDVQPGSGGWTFTPRAVADIDTGHYDDGHSFGWKRSREAAAPDGADTGHYDDGHAFGWSAPTPDPDAPTLYPPRPAASTPWSEDPDKIPDDYRLIFPDRPKAEREDFEPREEPADQPDGPEQDMDEIPNETPAYEGDARAAGGLFGAPERDVDAPLLRRTLPVAGRDVPVTWLAALALVVVVVAVAVLRAPAPAPAASVGTVAGLPAAASAGAPSSPKLLVSAMFSSDSLQNDTCGASRRPHNVYAFFIDVAVPGQLSPPPSLMQSLLGRPAHVTLAGPPDAGSHDSQIAETLGRVQIRFDGAPCPPNNVRSTFVDLRIDGFTLQPLPSGGWTADIRWGTASPARRDPRDK
jgi:hypothetical protein